VHYHIEGYKNALEKADRYLMQSPGDDAFREFRNEVAISLQFKSGYKLNAKECLILEPAAMEKGRTYPVLVILPFTGGTAGELLKHYLGSVSKHPCFVVVPPGLGSSADHSWEGFVACIERYEKHIADGLDRLETTHGTHIGKLYLAGFSLGGDLSWALPLRNPEKYAGAVIMATRCGYPAETEAVEILQSNGFRAFFLSGSEELAARLDGMKEAVSLFSEAGIEHRFEQVPGGHVRANSETFSAALGFLFD
jgi:pimeloyl-ACP methyl ester carboxylesterase